MQSLFSKQLTDALKSAMENAEVPKEYPPKYAIRVFLTGGNEFLGNVAESPNVDDTFNLTIENNRPLTVQTSAVVAFEVLKKSTN